MDIMTGLSSKEKREHLVERIMFIIDEMQNQRVTGELTLYFLQGRIASRVAVTRKEVLR